MGASGGHTQRAGRDAASVCLTCMLLFGDLGCAEEPSFRPDGGRSMDTDGGVTGPDGSSVDAPHRMTDASWVDAPLGSPESVDASEGSVPDGGKRQALHCERLNPYSDGEYHLASAIAADFLEGLRADCASVGAVTGPEVFVDWNNQLLAFVLWLFRCPLADAQEAKATGGYPPLGPWASQTPVPWTELDLAITELTRSIARLTDLNAEQAAALMTRLEDLANGIPTCDPCESRWNLCHVSPAPFE